MNISYADVDAMMDRIRDLVIPSGHVMGRTLDGTAWYLDTFPGGEIRSRLRIDDGGLTLTEVERAQTKPHLMFASPLLADMEKFLTYEFCSRVRGDMGLPMLLVVPIPVTIDKVAPGYTIVDPGGPGWELHHDGENIIRRGGSVIGLVEFSHYVALTPDEIRESGLDPEGKPHFMVWADN